MFLILRCTTFIGVCVEFVAAVVRLAELFPDPRQREHVLGYTQAFGSIGGVLVSGAYYLSVTYGASFPAIYGAHPAWRYTLLSGLIPAIPLMIVRPFLPESPLWKEKKLAGTLKRPSFREILAPQFRKTTLITALMSACSYGAAFGAIQHIPRIVPGLPEVAHLARAAQEQIVSQVQFLQEMGGLAGRVILAILAVLIVSRRSLLRCFQIPGLIVVPLVFYYAATHSLGMTQVGIFLAGLLTVGQFSFWGNYLPRVYPTYLRGTGESFAANIGGRMIGTAAALVTTQLANVMPGNAFTQLAYAAAGVAFVVYAVGLGASLAARTDEGKPAGLTRGGLSISDFAVLSQRRPPAQSPQLCRAAPKECRAQYPARRFAFQLWRGARVAVGARPPRSVDRLRNLVH